MEFDQLHFSHPYFFWALAVIPLVWLLFLLGQTARRRYAQLDQFIDSHLQPYLLMNHAANKKSFWPSLLLWSTAWALLATALAGPQWNLREIDTYTKDQSLVVLLDLSESMNSDDIKPSRLSRAKQKIEDLLRQSKGVKIGLIAFAADPHQISPLTDDKETLLYLLPPLDTSLVYVQGSRLAPALEMASAMLDAEPGSNKAILAISDGGFEDSSAILTAKKLAAKGIVLHALGVGTAEGAPVKDRTGGLITKDNAPVISKLEKERFAAVSHAGHGLYLDAHYTNTDVEAVLKELDSHASVQEEIGKKHQLWDEGFYLVLLPALPLILWWFRKGAMFALLLFLTPSLHADTTDYFKNQEQRAAAACECGDFEAAINTFQDPYRKGVACYKAGKYAEAETLFKQSTRPEVAANAAYNRGNALAGQNKIKEAITAYEEVLKQWPDHIKAKENLEILKKLQEEQDQQKQQDQQDQEGEGNSDQKENDQKKDQDQTEDEQNKDDKTDPGQNNQEKEEESENHPQNEDQQPSNQQQPPENNNEMPQPNMAEPQPKPLDEVEADQLLNRIESDPQEFMKNKFYIDSQLNGTKEGVDPW